MTEIEKRVFQIKTAREASTTRRCHILPHHGDHTIGQHTYGAVTLLLILMPHPSMALVRALMFHDTAERWLGDMPATAKAAFPGLGAIYEEAERAVLKKLDMVPPLTPVEEEWLKAVDTLDLYLWAREQMRMGNQELTDLRDKCSEAIVGRRLNGKLPPEVWEYFQWTLGHDGFRRNSDVFDEALPLGLD